MIATSKSGGPASFRLYVVEDHRLMLDAILACVARLENAVLAGRATDGASALREILELRPEVVLTDLVMPGLNGLELAKAVKSSLPGAKVIWFSAYVSAECIEMARELGIEGMIHKSATAETLASAIGVVAGGGKAFIPQNEACGLRAWPAPPRWAKPPQVDAPGLSSRQIEIIGLIAQGLLTKEIAGRLGVSCRTVDTHRQEVMKRLGLRGIAEVTRYAVRSGISSI